MVMSLKKILTISTVLMFSACVSGRDNDVLSSAVEQSKTSAFTQTTTKKIDNIHTSSAINSQARTQARTQASTQASTQYKPSFGDASFATDTTQPLQINPFAQEEILPPPPPPRIKKTYLINGLASSVKSIGYGFTNLSKKIPSAQLHNYASFVESSTVIRNQVSREIKAAYKANPDIEINLIGISFGANIVTWIAQELNLKKIPVNYLATLEGPAMSPIYKNVRLADNFSCTGATCFRTTSKLAWGNKKTDFAKFKIKASHIALANHPTVHQRIISQIDRPTKPTGIDRLVYQ